MAPFPAYQRTRSDGRSRSRDLQGDEWRESLKEFGDDKELLAFLDEEDDLVDLRDLSVSSDYLLALGSTRSVSNDSEKIYDDIQWLLDEEAKIEEETIQEKKKVTNKKRTAKNKNEPKAVPKNNALLPILPKPPAVPDKESLSKRLDALGDASTTEEEREQARNILATADEFILSHFDDALKELETGKQGTTSKLKLLLDIYSSLNEYLAPIYKLQQQIEDLTREAVEKRNQHRDEDALQLMRIVKQLEYKLAHLRDNLANQAGLPAEESAPEQPQPSEIKAAPGKNNAKMKQRTTTSECATNGPAVIVVAPST